MGSSQPSTDAIRLLTSHLTGDARATSQLLPLVYGRLKKLAAHYLKADFYAGLEVKEIARFLWVSERTVKGDWRVARTWLARELYRSASEVRP